MRHVVVASLLLSMGNCFALIARPMVRHSVVCSPIPAAGHSSSSRALPRLKRSRNAEMFGGGGPGGFLNLGAPEVIVIGAVAWAILGPKELFRLSREAGKFLGEWQQLGQQAKDQFQAALETEMAEEESASAAAASAAAGTAGAYSSNRQYPDDMSPSQAADIAPIGASGSNTDTGQTSGLDASSIPSLSEYSAQRDVGSTQSGTAISYEETEQLRASLYADLGEPTANDANFQNQISGARNEAVLQEYPAELSTPADGSPMDVQSSAEMLLQTEIEQAENTLATLKAEKTVLALKRKQLEANAERAQRMAEERTRGEERTSE